MAVCPGGDREGGPLNLVNRNRPDGQEPEHNADAAWQAAIAALPAPDASWINAEQLRDMCLREAEGAKHPVNFCRGDRCFRVKGP